MIRRRLVDLDAADRRRLAAVVAAIVVAAALDAWTGPDARALRDPIVVATVFNAIWLGLSALGSWLAHAGEAIGLAKLASIVAWLAGRVASFLASSGVMFARVWRGLKVLWGDVLRPAIRWVDTHVRRLYAWLHDTFKPIFNFLADVRTRLFDLYRRFVRPVLDTIDFIRAINRVLVALHIHVLEGLDRVLAAVERRIDGAFSWLLRQLARVQDVLDRVVTGGGLFQKWIMIASLSRYAPAWIHNFWTAQIGPVRGHDGSADRLAPYPVRQAARERDALDQYLDTGGGEHAGIIDELAVQVLQIANGVAPTTDDPRAVDELILG